MIQRSTEQTELLTALRDSLTGKTFSTLPDAVINEAKHQTVLPLICTDIEAYPVIASNVQLMWEQQQLSRVLSNIPYMILKGSCASIYYPVPLRRTLGDIDVLVRPEYFNMAYRAFEKAGYITKDPLNGEDRHVHFYHGTTVIELHRRYAILQSYKQEILLDNWLFQETPIIGKMGRYTFPMPDNELNGLVLLAHINQHLEGGLGLRHLVDWVMYVKACLPDEKWDAFRQKSDQLGLTTIAKVVAKFGQMYLGVNGDYKWCSDANENTVERLLNYIFEWGNFGHKNDRNNTVVMIMSHGRGVKGFFKNLQRQGSINWKRLEKQPYLRPAAWIYQFGRYIWLGIKSTRLRDFFKNYRASRLRNQLMDELGATRVALK